MITVILITAILAAALLVGIALAARCRVETAPNVIGWLLAIAGALSLFAWLTLSIVLSVKSFEMARELEAFYYDTQSAYEYTISATEEVVIDPSKTRGDAITDFSYQEQGLAVSERIREFRNKIAWYNEELRKLQGRNGWFILGAVFEDVSEGLLPITLAR